MFILLLLGSSLGVFGSAETDQERFKKALKYYDEENFSEAVEEFSKLAGLGYENGDLYYNLGNAYYRNGEVGSAVAAYLAAKKLKPRDPDILANLDFAFKQGQDQLAYQDASLWRKMAFWVDSVTPKELIYVAVLLLALGLLLLKPLSTKFKNSFMWLQSAVFFLSLSGIFFGAFFISWSLQEDWGAIASETAVIRSGPGMHNTAVFSLHEGAPFKYNGESSGWYKIELSDGKKGWVDQQQAKVFLVKNSRG